MNYREAIDHLFSLQRFGAELGLERARRMAERAGNPEQELKFIHVAGTNGKGSTCAMLEAIYREAGHRTGLFTSPHLVSFAERIQINRRNIPEGEVARLVSETRALLGLGEHATLFEMVTVMALKWFAEQGVGVVIWETGLGGRLDATNIVTPVASVITNIQMDHEKWLGSTLAEIAGEKAGIIKEGRPVFTAVDREEAWEVIRGTAERMGAPIERVIGAGWPGKIGLRGAHQGINAALAVATARGVADELPLGPGMDFGKALEGVRWPGRFDVRGRFVLDGAHNPDGARTLWLTLEEEFPGEKAAFIVGILADKDIRAMARELAPAAGRVFTVPVQSDRAAEATKIAEEFRAVAPGLEVEACGSLAEALERTKAAGRVVITGSLHFIGEAMEQLGFEAGPGGERSLNDWNANPDRKR